MNEIPLLLQTDILVDIVIHGVMQLGILNYNIVAHMILNLLQHDDYTLDTKGGQYLTCITLSTIASLVQLK